MLPSSFYARPTLEVARDLLGALVVRLLEDGQRLVGRIVETEAYNGPTDSANHARFGKTGRTAVMYGPPAHAYVYLNYGIHWMLNAVTEAEGFPAAVLIRAVEPLEGLETMQALRPGRSLRELTNGPGKLTRAMSITGIFHGHDLSVGQSLWFAPGPHVPDEAIEQTPRIGIDFANATDRDAPWRYLIRGNRWVSR